MYFWIHLTYQDNHKEIDLSRLITSKGIKLVIKISQQTEAQNQDFTDELYQILEGKGAVPNSFYKASIILIAYYI